MISTKPSGLFLHVKSKHDKEVSTPEKCFPCLKGFDPNAPAPAAAAPAPAKKKVAKKKEDDLSSLLSEGLTVSKKKK